MQASLKDNRNDGTDSYAHKIRNLSLLYIVFYEKTKTFITIAIVIAIMSTTVQVSQTTKQLLDLAKEEKKAETYDQVIKALLERYLHIPKSLFGVYKGMKWKKSDRMKAHGE